MGSEPKTNNRGFQVRALGEIAIRCSDIGAMAEFYGDIIGLEHLSGDHSDGIVFFKIAEGFGGHTSVLALFRHDVGREEIHPRSQQAPTTGGGSSLHHIALSLPSSEQESVIAWYEQNSISYTVQEFSWIGWRGIFANDPEGNTVELVAYDKSIVASPAKDG